jgi:drug/metabolite transporter (DMT)-like permease
MCAIWGTTWLAIKIGLRGLPPVTGAGVRFVLAALFLWILARFVPGPRGPAPPGRTIVILAATLFGGNYALTYYAETGLASGMVAVLFGALPFFQFALGALLLGERVGVTAVAGARLALGGVAAISLGSDTHGSLRYVFAILGAAAISAYATVELKKAAASDPFRTLPPAMCLAGVTMTLAGTAFEHPDWARGAAPSSIGAVLYLAVLGSGIAFYLNQWLLQRLDAWMVGLSTLVIPVIAVAAGALAGGEAFGVKELGGAALVIAGMWIALGSQRHPRSPYVTRSATGRARFAADTAIMRRRISTAAFALVVLLAAATSAHAASRYAGVYTTTRPGADSAQLLTLVLAPNGRASLTTRYPDLERSVGPSVLPVSQVGTWHDRGATAEVRFTAFGLVRDGKLVQPRRDNNVIAFALLHRCLLRAVRYSKITYGEVGLSMDKANCR